MAAVEPQPRAWRAKLWPSLGILMLAYIPPLMTHRGRVAADTKSYLYIDPSRMLGRAAAMWDANIGFGTVTHQNIGYLFPMGPYYWVMEQLGSPDWVAQRLWLGSLVAAAAFGTWYLCRTLGMQHAAVAVVVLAYTFSPYSLHYAARISVLLGPWAALPWMIAFTIKALQHRDRWRYPALFALTVQLVGSVNATALLFAGIGPALWLLWAWLGTRESSFRDVAAVALRIGALTIFASSWWIAGLSLQGGYGLDILRYTETLKAVARTSSPNEVMRGLGYWFFYGRDRLGPWIEASVNYTQRPRILFTGYFIASLALVSAGIVRWRHRGYFVLLSFIGVVIAVGAHPYGSPTPLGRLFKHAATSSAGLALRSTGRADPLVMLGFAMLLGAGVAATMKWITAHRRIARYSVAIAPIMIVVVLSNFPALYDGTYYGKNLERAEALPGAWRDLAAYVDKDDRSTRVLELPGSDFASYRFGNTVDPITPGMMDRPFIARELIPYGSAPSADFLNALDRRLQEGVFNPRGFADLLRRAGVGTVVVRNDIQWERYNLVRPRELRRMLSTVDGLAADRGFGPSLSDTDEIGIVDERTLNPDTLAGPDPQQIVVLQLPKRWPIVRAQGAGAPIIIDGDAEGLVDASNAGLLQGHNVVVYSQSHAADPGRLRELVGSDGVLVLTDQHRKRGRRWSTLLDNVGYTERAGEQPLLEDVSDNRLPVFPDVDDTGYTVVEQRGVRSVQATAYGNPISFTPEDRPAFALDGNIDTGWTVGAFDKVLGHRLEIALLRPTTKDNVRLTQILQGPRDRFITKVALRFDDSTRIVRELHQSSRTEAGELVSFPRTSFSKLTIEILATNKSDGPLYGGMSAVGFEEVGIVDSSTGNPVRVVEVTRLAQDLMNAMGSASASHPVVITLTRARVREVPPRSDEEPSMVRRVDLPSARSFSLTGDARVFPYATDPTKIDSVLGQNGPVQVVANQFLPGCLQCRGASALDGDAATAWVTPVNAVLDQWLRVRSQTPFSLDHIDLTFNADSRHSVPTELLVAFGGRTERVAVPPVTVQPKLDAPVTVRVPIARANGTELKFTITKVAARTTMSYYAGDAKLMAPVALIEADVAGLHVAALPTTIPSPCRTDLLTVNGSAVGVRISGAQQTAQSSDALPLTLCDPNNAGRVPSISLRKGENLIEVVPSRDVAIAVDRLELGSDATGAPGTPASFIGAPQLLPTVTTGSGRTAFDATVKGARGKFWFVLGQSYNEGWTASIDGRDLGRPTLIDGYANGWLVDEGTKQDFTINVEWTPQRRVWYASAVSVLAIVACFVLLLRGRRRPAVRPPIEDAWANLRFVNGTRSAITTRRLVAQSLVLAIVFGMAVAPWVGLLSAVAAWVAARVRYGRALIGFAGGSMMLLIGAYITQAQWRHHYPAVFEWPTLIDNMIMPSWCALMLVVVAWSSDRAATPAGPDSHPSSTHDTIVETIPEIS